MWSTEVEEENVEKHTSSCSSNLALRKIKINADAMQWYGQARHGSI